MSSQHGRLCRDLVGGSLRLGDNLILNKEGDLCAQNAKIKGDLVVKQSTIVNGNICAGGIVKDGVQNITEELVMLRGQVDDLIAMQGGLNYTVLNRAGSNLTSFNGTPVDISALWVIANDVGPTGITVTASGIVFPAGDWCVSWNETAVDSFGGASINATAEMYLELVSTELEREIKRIPGGAGSEITPRMKYVFTSDGATPLEFWIQNVTNPANNLIWNSNGLSRLYVFQL